MARDISNRPLQEWFISNLVDMFHYISLNIAATLIP